MTTNPETFEELLALWDSPAALSADLGIKYVTAQVMRYRGSISDTHWPRLIEVLASRGVHLTEGDLLAMKHRKARMRKGAVAA